LIELFNTTKESIFSEDYNFQMDVFLSVAKEEANQRIQREIDGKLLRRKK
jgi:hypothetical protein